MSSTAVCENINFLNVFIFTILTTMAKVFINLFRRLLILYPIVLISYELVNFFSYFAIFMINILTGFDYHNVKQTEELVNSQSFTYYLYSISYIHSYWMSEE